MNIGQELEVIFFLDLFKKTDTIELEKLNIVEVKFLQHSFKNVIKYFHDQGKELKIESNNINIYDLKRQTKQSIDEVNSFIDNFIISINHIDKYNYSELSNQCLDYCKEFITKYLEKYCHLDHFSLIQCNPLVPTGEEWSIPYEIGFSAGGFEIAYPNANNFTDEHIKHILSKGFTTKDRIYIDYCIWCHISILHEFVHSIQHICNLQDKSGWILEHDASRIQGILPCKIIKQLNYPDSFLYIIALHHLRIIDIIRSFHTIDSELISSYQKWRDSFGKFPPSEIESFAYNSENVENTVYLKQCIGVEGLMAHEGDDLEDILAFMFSRSGDLLATPWIEAPDSFKIPEHATLENLQSEATSENIDDLKEILESCL